MLLLSLVMMMMMMAMIPVHWQHRLALCKVFPFKLRAIFPTVAGRDVMQDWSLEAQSLPEATETESYRKHRLFRCFFPSGCFSHDFTIRLLVNDGKSYKLIHLVVFTGTREFTRYQKVSDSFIIYDSESVILI